MKKIPSFKVDDKVFAKVKGYPAWPARIAEDKGGKYNVQFYGTLETAIVKPKDLYYYLQHKSTFVKTLKRKDYNEAIQEIEAAITEDGGSDGSVEHVVDNSDNVTSTAASKPENTRKKRKRSASSDGNPSKRLVVEPAIAESGQKERTTRAVVEQRTLRSTRSTSVSEEEILTDDSENAQSTDEQESALETLETNDDKNKLIAEEPVVTARDIKIVTEQYLNAVTAYAKYVRKDPRLFKRKPIDPRPRFNNETVITKLPSGKFIGIKYNRDPIPLLTNEYDRAIYDETEAKTVLSLKKLLEEGKCDPQTDKSLFIMNVDITEAEIHEIVKLELIKHKQARVNLLKIESSLIECDARIKRCLTLDRAHTTVAIEMLERLLRLKLQPLMLKKHPHIVDMVRRLRHYIGNPSAWNFTNEQYNEFQIAAGEIRSKADDVFYKFSELFKMPNETVFWEVFNDEVDSFRDQLNCYSESFVFALTCEPNSRQSFLNDIEDDEEIKKIISRMEKTKSEPDDVCITYF